MTSTRPEKVFQVVSGWQAFELILKCILIGVWQIIQITVKKLWKGHRRKSRKNSTVELKVDSSIGTHCYIKIMGVKYHYVETGPRDGKLVLILGNAPDTGNLWGPNWANVVRRLAETGHHIITLDLRGTGGSEGGSRRDLAPPRAVEELAGLLEALGASERKPAIMIGFGIGGLLTWYLAHCHGELVSKFVVVGAPHPNLYWQHPPAAFCERALHFIQWPHFPERWLADGALQEEGRWASSRARDWSGALNYVRGAAWWRIQEGHRAAPPALLVGAEADAAQLVTSAAYCRSSTLRLVAEPEPSGRQLSLALLEFLAADKPPKSAPEPPQTYLGRVLGAVAGRGRDITVRTARMVLPAQA